MNESSENVVDVEIDRLTNSIISVVSGDVFATEVVPVKIESIQEIKKHDWKFDWKKEIKQADRQVYKLVIKNNKKIIQGLISISDQNDHIYMHLIENSSFNKSKNKQYEGVPGNLVAFACKVSLEKGYDGYLSFDAKTALIKHYEKTLFATHLHGTKMYIDTRAALRLINQYFK
ncbi:MAG: hypothetical protein B6D64_14440 [Bacteroidetes bacterium 4484_276]|nr:MAG: hypothetical protein B6D64_14440 [Bacteroidetes bacterium 4484_276]